MAKIRFFIQYAKLPQKETKSFFARQTVTRINMKMFQKSKTFYHKGYKGFSRRTQRCYFQILYILSTLW